MTKRQDGEEDEPVESEEARRARAEAMVAEMRRNGDIDVSGGFVSSRKLLLGVASLLFLLCCCFSVVASLLLLCCSAQYTGRSFLLEYSSYSHGGSFSIEEFLTES